MPRKNAHISSDSYAEYRVIDPSWGDDAELVEEWFEQGEELQDDWIDWLDWIDLYNPKVERADIFVHWVRCLFDPDLPRPRELKAA